MIEYSRGDIVLVNLEPAIGREQRGLSRPGLVISPGALNKIFNGIIVCPITDARHIKQSELGLTYVPAGESKLNKNSLVIAFQIRMIDKRRVIGKLGSISDTILSDVNKSLMAALDL